MIRDVVYLVLIMVLLAAPISPSQTHHTPELQEPEPLQVTELCPTQYTLGAPLAGIHVAVLPGAPRNLSGFYEQADQVFHEHTPLLPPVHVDSLDAAWNLRASVYHDVLALTTGPLLSPSNETAWGWTCAYRALVAHYPEQCPWRVALHELGHLLQYRHQEIGIMSTNHCDLSPPTKTNKEENETWQ